MPDHDKPPIFGDLADGSKHRWPCPNGKDGREHSGHIADDGGYKLYCFRSEHSSVALARELGVKAPSFAEMNKGQMYLWPCSDAEKDANHVAVLKEGAALKCKADIHSYTEIAKEIGMPLQPRSERNNDEHLVCVYERKLGASHKVWRIDTDTSKAPCGFSKCTNQKEVHKHIWTTKPHNLKGLELYAWSPLADDSVLVICEGEKAAAALSVDGYVGVSYAGGSKNAAEADYSLCDGRDVIVWPDNDDDGLKAANVVLAHARLAGAARVRRVWLPDDDVLLNEDGAGVTAPLFKRGYDAADATPQEQARLLGAATDAPMPSLAVSSPAIEDMFLSPTVENQNAHADAVRFIAFAAPNLVLIEMRSEQGDYSIVPYIRMPNGLLDNGAALQQVLTQCVKWSILQAGSYFDKKEEVNAAIRYLNRLLTEAGENSMKRQLPGAMLAIGRSRIEEYGGAIVDRQDIGLGMRYVAFSNGIVDKQTGEMIDGALDRDVYLIGNVRWEYDPDATHPDVDALMPDISTPTKREAFKAANPTTWEQHTWWRTARGVMAQRMPNREAISQISDPGAGKSTWRAADIYALAPHVTTMRAEALKDSYGGSSSHDGDRAAVASPAWWTYVPEVKRTSPEVVNDISGGTGVMNIRRVGEKTEQIIVTAHMVIQGNPKDYGQQMLGLDGGAESEALISRLSPMRMRTIAKPNKRLLGSMLGDRERCQAWIVRVIQDCKMAYESQMRADGWLEWPEPITDMKDELIDMTLREAAEWKREILPRYLVTNDTNDAVWMTDVLAGYNEWHEDQYGNDPKAKKVTRNALTAALFRYLGGESELTKDRGYNQTTRKNDTYLFPVRLKTDDEMNASKPEDDEENPDEDWMK